MMNTYSCDIHIPNTKSGNSLMTTRNVMTGCAAATVAEAVQKGISIVSCPRGYGHEKIVYVHVYEICHMCKGSGNVVIKRRVNKICKLCKSIGSWHTGKIYTVLNQ